MTPTLLAYQIDPNKLGKMQIVCLRLGIRVQAVDPADFGQTIGALAGVLPREPDAPAAPLPGEMLVMAHFRPGLLEGMLQGWRARLKACAPGFMNRHPPSDSVACDHPRVIAAFEEPADARCAHVPWFVQAGPKIGRPRARRKMRSLQICAKSMRFRASP